METTRIFTSKFEGAVNGVPLELSIYAVMSTDIDRFEINRAYRKKA